MNRLFDEWERRAAMEEERRNAAKLFNDRCNSLEVSLSEYEKQIIKVCIPFLFSLPKLPQPKFYSPQGLQGAAAEGRGVPAAADRGAQGL